MYVCPNRDMCMLVQVSTEAREGHQILWCWSYRWLEATIMSARNRTGILWENNMCSWLLSHCTSPDKTLHVCMGACVCTCVQRSGVNTRCFVQFLSSLVWSGVFRVYMGWTSLQMRKRGISYTRLAPLYLSPWGISIMCIASTMPSSALPVCMFCVDGTGTFTFLVQLSCSIMCL